jgi:uncharacterized protein YgiM (DUF1202 family)
MPIKKKRYFGITKIRRGQKMCWLSKQDKNGWSLGIALPSRTIWITGVRFKTIEEVKAALDNDLTNAVFVHLKGSEEV